MTWHLHTCKTYLSSCSGTSKVLNTKITKIILSCVQQLASSAQFVASAVTSSLYKVEIYHKMKVCSLPTWPSETVVDGPAGGRQFNGKFLSTCDWTEHPLN